MKRRSLFIFCIILVSAGSALSQKTMTNAQLEKYRQQRLNAEREYRENYERLGLPSPEELDRRREESRIQTEELSAKLRAERLERERIEAQREAELLRAAQFNRQLLIQQQGLSYADPGFISYGGYGEVGFGSFGKFRSGLFHFGVGHNNRRHFRRPFRHVPAGYVGGGQFWRTGAVRPLSAPMLIQTRR